MDTKIDVTFFFLQFCFYVFFFKRKLWSCSFIKWPRFKYLAYGEKIYLDFPLCKNCTFFLKKMSIYAWFLCWPKKFLLYVHRRNVDCWTRSHRLSGTAGPMVLGRVQMGTKRLQLAEFDPCWKHGWHQVFFEPPPPSVNIFNAIKW